MNVNINKLFKGFKWNTIVDEDVPEKTELSFDLEHELYQSELKDCNEDIELGFLNMSLKREKESLLLSGFMNMSMNPNDEEESDYCPTDYYNEEHENLISEMIEFFKSKYKVKHEVLLSSCSLLIKFELT